MGLSPSTRRMSRGIVLLLLLILVSTKAATSDVASSPPAFIVNFTSIVAASSPTREAHGHDSAIIDFLKVGGIPFDKGFGSCQHNSALLGALLQHNASHHTLHFPPNITFYFHHGIVAYNVTNCILEIDGTIKFERASLPINQQHHPFPACLTLVEGHNITVTTSWRNARNDDQSRHHDDRRRGLIDGQGSQWWGVPFIGYLHTVEHRPRLLRFNLTTDVLVEHVILQDSPYHTLYLDTVNRVEIRNISIVARRTPQDGHSWMDLTAFNSDGIDVSGHNVHVHDVDIWVQDDCVAVKDAGNHTAAEHVRSQTIPYVTSNMTLERINCSGVGATVGSIVTTAVRNITFRDVYLHKSIKGIYMKFAKRKRDIIRANLSGSMEHILYHNIYMYEPLQWPIWMGPSQQSDSIHPCHANPCSLCWPMMTPSAQCHVVPQQFFFNITLRHVQIVNPHYAPGVLYGHRTKMPLDHVLFDSVRVSKGPPPLASQRLLETFPGLRQPIHDFYVTPTALDANRHVNAVTQRVMWLFTWVHDFVWLYIQQIINQYVTVVGLHILQYSGGAERWLTFLGLERFILDQTIVLWTCIAMAWSFCGLYYLQRWTVYGVHQRQLRMERRRQEQQQQREERAEQEEEGAHEQEEGGSQEPEPYEEEEDMEEQETKDKDQPSHLAPPQHEDVAVESSNFTSNVDLPSSSLTAPLLALFIPPDREALTNRLMSNEREETAPGGDAIPAVATTDDVVGADSTGGGSGSSTTISSPGGCCTRRRSVPRWARHFSYGVLVVGCFTAAAYSLFAPFRKPAWERTYKYYACKGVLHGVATGNTWPVPSCFQRHHASWWIPDDNKHPDHEDDDNADDDDYNDDDDSQHNDTAMDDDTLVPPLPETVQEYASRVEFWTTLISLLVLLVVWNGYQNWLNRSRHDADGDDDDAEEGEQQGLLSGDDLQHLSQTTATDNKGDKTQHESSPLFVPPCDASAMQASAHSPTASFTVLEEGS